MPGFGPGVVFGVTSPYTLTASGAGLGGKIAVSFIEMRIPGFSFDERVLDTFGGTFTGSLNSSKMIFTTCPCIFSLELSGSAAAANGAVASVSDPITTELPPGWTYTAASQMATPEPSSLVLLGSGLLGLAGVIRRKLSH